MFLIFLLICLFRHAIDYVFLAKSIDTSKIDFQKGQLFEVDVSEDDVLLEGYINKTCVFEVKRITNIPKREIQILAQAQLAQLFKITNRKYPYLTPIIKNLITLKQPLNTILTGNEQEKKSLKRKIRNDFYKIKQVLGLTNYMFDDLRFCQKCVE